MTQLQMTPGNIISAILFTISVVGFIFVYNKAIRNRVDKSDLKEMKEYVDQQDRAVASRVDELKADMNTNMMEIRKQLNIIINKLL